MSGTYKLIDYFDVWFNEEEGYWVNDLCTHTEGITITNDATDEDIFKYLTGNIEYPRLQGLKFEDVTFEGDDFFIELSTEKDGYTLPLCRLERER